MKNGFEKFNRPPERPPQFCAWPFCLRNILHSNRPLRPALFHILRTFHMQRIEFAAWHAFHHRNAHTFTLSVIGPCINTTHTVNIVSCVLVHSSRIACSWQYWTSLTQVYLYSVFIIICYAYLPLLNSRFRHTFIVSSEVCEVYECAMAEFVAYHA